MIVPVGIRPFSAVQCAAYGESLSVSLTLSFRVSNPVFLGRVRAFPRSGHPGMGFDYPGMGLDYPGMGF